MLAHLKTKPPVSAPQTKRKPAAKKKAPAKKAPARKAPAKSRKKPAAKNTKDKPSQAPGPNMGLKRPYSPPNRTLSPGTFKISKTSSSDVTAGRPGSTATSVIDLTDDSEDDVPLMNLRPSVPLFPSWGARAPPEAIKSEEMSSGVITNDGELVDPTGSARPASLPAVLGQDEVTQLRTELAKCRNDLQAQIQRAEQWSGQCAKLANERSAYQGEQEKTRKKQQELEEEVERLRQKRGKAEDAFTKERERMSIELGAAKKEALDLKASIEHVRMSVEPLQRENNELRDKLHRQQDDTTTDFALGEEKLMNADLTQRLESLNKDLTSLREDLQAEKRAYVGASQRLNSLKSELEGIKKDLDNEQSAHATTKRKLSDIESDKASFKESLDNEREAYAALKKSFDDAKKDHAALQKVLDQQNMSSGVNHSGFSTSLRASNSVASELKAKNASLKQKLDESKSANAHMQTRLQTLVAENKNLEEDYDLVNRQVETLELESEKLKAQIKALQGKITELNVRFEANQSDSGITIQLEALRAENEALRASHLVDVDDEANTFATMKSEIAALKAENEELRKGSFRSTPTLPSSTNLSDLEQLRSENIRKTYFRVKKKYDNLFSISRDISTATRGMNMSNFGDFGGHLRQLKDVIEEDETED